MKESDNETDELDTEPGKEKEKDLDFLPENFIIASVILIVIFSLNLFSVTQDLMSSICFCTERKRSGI